MIPASKINTHWTVLQKPVVCKYNFCNEYDDEMQRMSINLQNRGQKYIKGHSKCLKSSTVQK